MAFDGFEVVFFTAGFFVPGFVWSAVLSMLVPRRAPAEGVRHFEFLTLSCINHGLWSWALFLIFQTGFSSEHPYWTGMFLGVIIFVSPVVLGILTGMLQQRETVVRLLRRFGIRTVHPVAHAWDWHFSRLKPYWVVVTLKDESQVYGFFGTRSFAGSSPESRDIFLEAQFRPLETGEWAPLPETGGVLIVGDEIATFEFRTVEGIADDE